MTLRAVPERPYDAAPVRRRAEPHQVPPEAREALRVRCGGLCECCGDPLPRNWVAHHRRRRSQGGDDSVSNLVALIPLHHDRIHSRVAKSQEGGFLLVAGQSAARARLALHWERWVRLARDGSYILLGGDT